MTIIHVSEMNVIYYMYITEIQFFVSLYNYTIANNNYDFELEGGEYYLELTEPILFYYLNITTDWKYLVN